MTEFVLCYAASIDNPDIDWIVLIEKKNPSWRAGNFSLPGGPLQKGESPVEAAVRVLQWQTSLVTLPQNCTVLGTMHGVDYTTHVVICPFQGPFSVCYDGHEERPLVTGLREALGIGMSILPELRVIIPLCIAQTHFQMIVSNDQNYFNYTLQVT